MAPLLSEPDLAKADSEAAALLNSRFQTIDQLQLDDLLEQARQRHEVLQGKVRVYPDLTSLSHSQQCPWQLSLLYLKRRYNPSCQTHTPRPKLIFDQRKNCLYSGMPLSMT